MVEDIITSSRGSNGCLSNWSRPEAQQFAEIHAFRMPNYKLLIES